MKIAILITCYNRKDKTVRCIESLEKTYLKHRDTFDLEIFMTDDGCTDGTADAVKAISTSIPIHILQGNGNLYWNAGMNHSWRTAIDIGGFDGYLWVNDDTTIFEEFWDDLSIANVIAKKDYGKYGIYVGSTCDSASGEFSYGGFNFTNKWTLKDKFILPNSTDFQPCQCAHGNILYVSNEVVSKLGVLCDSYFHGGGDHDYTYLAHKAGFPILVMPHYAGECDNDHKEIPKIISLKHRIQLMPASFKRLKNNLLFNWRCFPYRVPFVFIKGCFKIFFSKQLYAYFYK